MDPFPPAPAPAGPAEEPRDLWYVGAIINVIGSIAINLGTNLMKLGHNKRAKMDMPEDQKPPTRKIKEWVVGMSFFTVGNILNFVSFGFAAQSLLAALGSIQFVSNVIFASFVLKEKINRMVLTATACIVGGCVLLVVFGNQSSATYDVKQLTQLYGKPAYVVYLCLMAAGVVGGYLLHLHCQKMVSKLGPRGIWYAILPVSYAVYSALIGTQSVLFSKSMSVILRLTFTGDNQLGNWYTWVVLPVFFLTAIFWITRLNKGLRMFPAMIIVPVMQISWTLFSIISGMLYFQEYLGFTPLKSAMFPLGVLIVFIGVFLLTQSASSKQGSYQKMQEETASKAVKQDSAASVFGSLDAAEPALQQRAASIDYPRSESSAFGAEPAIVAPAGFDSPDPARRESVEMAAEPLPGRRPSQDLKDEGSLPPGTPIRSSVLDVADSKPTDSPSMMDKVKGRLRSMQELGVEARAGLRQVMGLGDGAMPAISLFAMPTMMDYAASVNPSGRYTENPVTTDAKEEGDTAGGLRPIAEELETQRSAASFTTLIERRNAADPVQLSASSNPNMPRPGTAPASPRSGLGRTLIDRAERAAKSSMDVLKKAPSNLQRVVREKQGYGSLHEDEETGLLQMTDVSDAPVRRG
ncbi:NIPA-like protein 2 [Tetrabaena socialis]|uniref:Probable magnesium transporter n=1 Tax=Tetrabaena socialis TaxID=47790 RepID=A0A2J7ZNH9_9CHLO|nr:NIPA-like protein 2 [Tetrabaena socialis]|eukprot:PNH01815.1 NIPA-like protein 2 [Tetrabaena socialis]